MYARRTAALATLLALAACGGSSTPQAQSKPPASSSPVAAASSAPVSVASEAGLQAQPAPASFPDGEYARTVKLQGELDGRWRLTLRHDGRYELVSPQSKTSEGIYVVDQKQIIFTAPDCGAGAYAFTVTAVGLHFDPIGNDGCDDRGPLLAGQDWEKSS